MLTKPFIDDRFSVAYSIFSHATKEPISVTIEPFNMRLSYYTPYRLGVRCFLHYMRLEHTRLQRGVDIIIDSSHDREDFTLLNAMRDMEFFSANNCRNISSDTVLRQHLSNDSYFCYRCYQLRMGRFINSNFGAVENMLYEIELTPKGLWLLSRTNFNTSKIITERDFK